MPVSAPPNPIFASSQVAQGPRLIRSSRTKRSGLIGVDIGSRTVKVAQVARCGESFELVAASCIDIAKATQHQTLGNAIASALQTGPFHKSRLACLLPKACYSEESLEGEHSPSASFSSRMWTHLQRRGVLRPEDVTIDYWPTEPATDPERTPRCQIVAVRNRVVDDFVKDCQSAGIHVQCVDSIPFAALRLVDLHDPSLSSQSVAILDWGSGSTRFTLVRHGVPVYSRELRGTSLSAAAEAIADRFGISIDDAFSLTHGLAEQRNGGHEFGSRIRAEISSALQPLFSSFERELQKTLAYIDVKLRVDDLQKVVVIGGGSVLANAIDSSDRLGGVLGKLNIDISRLDIPGLSADALLGRQLPIYANAISLSSLGWSDTRR